MKNKILYLLIGISLLFGYFFTSIDSIDKNTLELIKGAYKIDTESIWEDFNMKNYPIDVNYGQREYRYYLNEIKEKSPDIKVLALSAINTSSGPVLKVIPENLVRKIIDTGNLSLEKRNLVYISFLVHEAFHCYQMDNGFNGNLLKDGNLDEKEKTEFNKYQNILTKLDHDLKYQELWIEEMKSLEKYYKTKERDSWIENRQVRINYEREVLKDDFEFFRKWFTYKELLEGTARYVEEKSMEQISKTKYPSDFSNLFIKGDGKLYESGALKCFILDKEKVWKDIKFDGSINLDELLIEHD